MCCLVGNVNAEETEVLGNIDTPISNQIYELSEEMIISGWSLDTTGIESVNIYIDGKEIGTAEYGMERKDVLKEYPDMNNSLNSGFQYVIKLEGMSLGVHELSVKIINVNSEELILPSNVLFNIVNTEESTENSIEITDTMKKKINYIWIYSGLGLVIILLLFLVIRQNRRQ